METEHSVCIILEYAKGVELFDFVQTQHAKKVEEDLVKQIFLQLVGVVQWMHQHNIVHRDLKLESKSCRLVPPAGIPTHIFDVCRHFDTQGRPGRPHPQGN